MIYQSAFVYAITVDGVARYVGKGSGGRIREHVLMMRKIARRRAAGQKVVASHFYNRLVKAFLGGANISWVVIEDGLSHADAFNRERLEIAAAPEGQLWNLREGGYGGAIMSEALRLKISRSMLLRYQRPGERAKITEHFKTMWADPEHRERHLRALRKQRQDPVYRARLSVAIKDRCADPEVRERRRAAALKRWSNPEYQEKQRRAALATWANPERVKKQRAYVDSPEGRAQLSRGGKNSLAKRYGAG